MTNATPYDHNTPPPSPPNIIQSQAPLSSAILQADVASLQTLPAAYASTPRPPPREGGNIARDGLFYPLTKSASCPGSALYALKLQNPQPATNTTNHLHIDTKQAPDRKVARDILRGITPLTPTEPNKVMSKNMLLPEVTEKAKADTTAKPTTWVTNLRKKHRPCEIFNINFSFRTPSKRREADRTPPISPRGSMSSVSGLTKPTPEEPYKRRIHKPKFAMTFIKQSSPNRTPPEKLMSIWGLDASRGRPVCTSTEAHPGTLVDFSSPSHSPSGCNKVRHDSQSYHAYLSDSTMRTPDSEDQIFFPLDELDAEERRAESEVEEEPDKKSRILGLTSKITRTKRACTLERKAGNVRRTGPRSSKSPSSSNSSNLSTSQGSGRSNSTLNDPNMDRFLRHVRESKHARAQNGGNGGYVDEDDGAFWSSGAV